MSIVLKLAAFLCLVTGVPATALAQGAIAGTVQDGSGTPVPGVTVTATSAVLIERGRTVVTDGAGQYRIEDLRPGIYTVSFSGSDLSPVVREGIELSGSFTATVNVAIVLGRLSEAITVTGQAPVVDVHTARREVTLKNDVLKSIPTVRSYNALLVLLPGVVTNTNDTVTGTAATQFPIHGGRTAEGRLSLDGLTVGSPPNGNSPTNYVVDVGNAAEPLASVIDSVFMGMAQARLAAA